MEEDRLKELVDRYINYVRSDDFHEDNDWKNYIYEAAVEKYYGHAIWHKINARLSGSPWPEDSK